MITIHFITFRVDYISRRAGLLHFAKTYILHFALVGFITSCVKVITFRVFITSCVNGITFRGDYSILRRYYILRRNTRVQQKLIIGSIVRLHFLNLSIKLGSPILDFIKHYLVTGSVALMDFITYLVTNFFFFKSNIGDPTLEI